MRASHNRSSLPKRDATRERLDISFPEGILLTTHDHALLTKNFRALALGEINKSSFKSARSAHTTELAACNAHATLRRPARPPVFFVFNENFQKICSDFENLKNENISRKLSIFFENNF